MRSIKSGVNAYVVKGRLHESSMLSSDDRASSGRYSSNELAAGQREARRVTTRQLFFVAL